MAMSLPDGAIDQERDASFASSPDQVRIVEQLLRSEFAHLLPPEVIERVASEAVERFDEVPVQTFVPILAVRTARQLARAIAHGGDGWRFPNATTASATVSKMESSPIAPATP
jgi:hypothetical protein